MQIDPTTLINDVRPPPSTLVELRRRDGWSKRDMILAVACSVAIAANALFVGLTLAPIGATAAFVFFYKAFAVWTQLSNIALCAVAIITLVHKNIQNIHMRNILQPLAL